MTSDLYTSLIWFKSAQLAEFRYYSFKCFVQRGAMYGFLSALDFLNFIISAFPNFELKFFGIGPSVAIMLKNCTKIHPR